MLILIFKFLDRNRTDKGFLSNVSKRSPKLMSGHFVKLITKVDTASHRLIDMRSTYIGCGVWP